MLKEIYKSTALAWAVAMSWALALQKPWIALSITFGTMLGAAVLLSYDWVVHRAFTPEARKPKRALWKLALAKYPLLGAMLYGVVRWDKISLVAFCGGIMLVHVAIVAKMIGFRIVERMEAEKPALPTGRARVRNKGS